jgi:hypothetical protein
MTTTEIEDWRGDRKLTGLMSAGLVGVMTLPSAILGNVSSKVNWKVSGLTVVVSSARSRKL